jgi:NAD(P)-dependent dehydrogenase (short-subunit alcohol dehydrogenase family)
MKYILITGASSDIGRAIALKFARPQTTLILSGRDKARLTEASRQVQRRGGQSQIVIADLSAKAGINKLIRATKAKAPTLDVFVHTAAIWHDDRRAFCGIDYENYSPEVILDTFMVGLVAPALLAQAFIPLMPTGGNILTISGTFADGAKGWLPYFASKRGLEDFSVGLAEELQRKDIRVHCLSPSDVATGAYKKYFPEYAGSALSPKTVADRATALCAQNPPETVWVAKKGRPLRPGFHK